MASSGNFSTMNPLSFDNATFSKGNLLVNTDGNYADANSTFVMTSGKWYIEARNDGAGLSNFERVIGIRKTGSTLGTVPWSDSNKYVWFAPSGNIRNNSNVSYGSSWTADGDIIGIALDLDNNALWFSKNNTWQNSATKTEIENGTTTNAAFTGLTNEDGYTLLISSGDTAGRSTGALMYVNFGQDSTFGGDETAGGNADSNGFGDFFYAPPSGFLALCSANLPVSDDIDPAQTDDDFPQKNCNTVLYTGDGNNNRSVTGVGFKPDLLWGKIYSSSDSHFIYDSQRGSGVIRSDQDSAEADYSAYWSQFDSDGWTFGNQASSQNLNNGSFVAWCWRANGGTTSSNTDGSITSTVQTNTAAGFSIVTYTGNATNGATFGHGLSAKPSFVLIKNRDAAQKWAVWHQSADMTDYQLLFLNTNAGKTTEGTQRWDVSAISSSVFGLGSHPEINGSGADYVAYLWHDVEGYSKFGTYTGNSNADGPFIYTGFRPQIIILKGLVTGSGWLIKDDTIDGFNPGTGVLEPNQSSAKYTTAGGVCDILSNGFKIRTANSAANSTSYDPYVYMAWGSVPFKYNNTF